VTAGGTQVFAVFDAQVYALYGTHVMATLAQADISAVDIVIPAGERSKSAGALGDLYTFLLGKGIARADFVLACGGGVVSDLSGYAAATILRGVRWGILSTTLLGMVDAAIGGKTGINHKLGKNLIGAFWQPAFVVSDTEFLSTLPSRHLVAGLGEVLKYAGLAGGEFPDLVEKYLDRGDLLHHSQLRKLIRLSARYKADIVARDVREGELRMILNLGHTFAHAIEKTLGFGRLLHGEAVILGLDAAIELSGNLRAARRTRLKKYRELIWRLFPEVPQRRLDVPGIMDAMALDKKRSGSRSRFILLDSPGRPIITDTVPAEAVADAVTAMLEHYRAKGVRT
jgi:3-dehydroquinate synthase